jgi:tetratricopeptide (TPR) repeat protein
MENQNERLVGFMPNSLKLNLVKGDCHLLVIGIDKYQYPYPYINLDNAQRDAANLAEELQQRYSFKQVKKLFNGDATRHAIIKSIETFEVVNKSDNVIIFFAGHGYCQQPLGYIVPHDAPIDTKSGFIPYSTIVEHFNLIPARHILLILDCCYGGLLLKYRDSLQINQDIQKQEILISRKFISSGHIEKVPDGIIGGNSPFMKILLETLKNNQEPQLSINALYQKIIDDINVKQAQIPLPICSPLSIAGDDGGDMILRLENQEDEESKAYQKAILLRKKTELEFFLDKFTESKYKNEVESIFQNEFEEQKREWEKARTIRTIKSVSAYIDKYRDEFFFAEARIELLKLEKSKPFYEKALTLRGIADAELEKNAEDTAIAIYKEAIDCLTQAIAIYPNFAAAYDVRADLHKFFGNHQNVIDDYSASLRIEFDTFTYSDRAFAKLRMGQKEEALKDFNSIIETEPNNANLYLNRAMTKDIMGDKIGALQDYLRSFDINPNDIFVQNEIELLNKK